MLLIHICVALTSLIFGGYTLFSPTIRKLRILYASVFATIATGTYLIVTTPFHIMTTCLEGLVYIFFVVATIAYATHKLHIAEKQQNEQL